ncbi:conserved exported hypothetical protein [Rubrivivax sp. A210]|uniref:zinc-dependent metalloprotease n=1 Tax=Rubrivivax sp. A210 TaxID=2772301 RepID=UPI00191B36DA|nr:zinc-dependent metalloprotease [Rubrivivax sp. A210]CAD5373320.1 conserved exported hypothetical protein [Rubrivivax sp. A210]
MQFPLRHRAAGLAFLLAATWAGAQQAPGAAEQASPLEGARQIGAGRLTAFSKEGHILVTVPADALGKPFLWYTEVVGVPAGMVAGNGLGVGSMLARLERQGDLLHVRDLSTVQQRRGGHADAPRRPAAAPGAVPGARPDDPKTRPIDIALGSLETGPIVASFPILGANAQGTLLSDFTSAFSTDFAAASGRAFVAGAGLVPVALDPSRSYIDRVRVAGESLAIRSHLTYMASVPGQAALGPQPLSIVLGHSWLFLPERPMASRPADPRVGFFSTRYTQFEADRGTAQDELRLISRFRLEKANPQAAVSDPVKPITFYIGPGVPARWRPYIAAGIRQWLPVFEAAGFSNAIRVLDAPTPEQDPNWWPEDVTINVIRWVPEPRANAMGPHVIDPRSGEVLAAHVYIWPTVIDFFGQYYWSMFGGGVDPEAARLPLSTEKSGALLSYIVAHEVGHTLGLAHNQIASTAYSVAQLRDRGFANREGPNSSIMAYGRFNQVAQPGDGVTRLWATPGPYDYAAIRYGYGDFGSDPAVERRALSAFAASFAADRRLYWGSEEGGEMVSRFGRDPRVQTENVGAERIEATRLGVANLLRSLERLDAATGGDARLYSATYDTLLGRQLGLLKSVKRLIAAALPPLGQAEGPLAALVPAAEQRQAVRYLLGEAAASLEPYARPAVVERVSVYGGYRAIDRLQAGLVADLMNGPNVALLESQRRRDPAAYSSLDLGQDVSAAVWSDLRSPTPTRRALQRGYIDAARDLLKAWDEGRGAREESEARAALPFELTLTAGRALAESGDDTVFMPWLRGYLPALERRLHTAARQARAPADRLHYADMATQVARLMKLGAP